MMIASSYLEAMDFFPSPMKEWKFSSSKPTPSPDAADCRVRSVFLNDSKKKPNLQIIFELYNLVVSQLFFI